MDVGTDGDRGQRRELLPAELDLFIDEAEQPESPALEVDARGTAVREHRPVVDDLLSGRQAVAPLLAVFASAGEDIRYHNASSNREYQRGRQCAAETPRFAEGVPPVEPLSRSAGVAFVRWACMGRLYTR